MTSDELTAALLAHFGAQGLRSNPVAPEGPLRAPGLPVQVGAYFSAAGPAEPLALGQYAAQHGQDAGPMAGQLRLGTDRGAEFYLAPDASVRAVLLGTGLPDLPVNGSLAAFAEGLLLLDRHLPALSDAEDQPGVLAGYQQLRQALIALDAAAFEYRESWWPRVLDDLRRPLNIDSSAAFEYLDSRGEKQISTAIGGIGLPHPEELAWYRLRAEGVQPEQVTRVYCELEACMMPGHYCSLWMARTFPNAAFTHSFDYGDTAASREAGVKALMQSVAELRERR